MEYRVKAAMLYNFTRFVRWPEAALTSEPELTLCVLGHSPFGSALDTVAGKPTHDRALGVRHVPSRERVDGCAVLFISDSEREALEGLLQGIEGQPVLTVSELEGFIDRGGMIRFVVQDNKVRFRINLEAAKRAGLSISSKLLRLAQTVRRGTR